MGACKLAAAFLLLLPCFSSSSSLPAAAVGEADCKSSFDSEVDAQCGDETALLQRRTQGAAEYSVTLKAPHPSMTFLALVYRVYLKFDAQDDTAWLNVKDLQPPFVGPSSGASWTPMVSGISYSSRLMPAPFGDQFSVLFWPGGRGSESGKPCTWKSGGACDPRSGRSCFPGLDGNETCIVNVKGVSEFMIKGSFPPAAYNKIAVTWANATSKTYTFLTDSDFTMVGGRPNPYVLGNPSVFASGRAVSSKSSRITESAFLTQAVAYESDSDVGDIDSAFDVLSSSALWPSTNGSSIPIVRFDQASTSALANPDGIGSDGCANTYLAADVSKMAILRMKLPKVFISANGVPPPETFGQYHLRYWSVSSHILDFNPELKYWYTVNVNMLNATADLDGYGYVFFLPMDDAVKLQKEQGLPTWQAPIFSWGRFRGPVLFGSSVLLFRYKAQDPSWEGSVCNAPCYPTKASNVPLAPDALGAYTPQLVACSGDTLADLSASTTCGSVTREVWA